MILEYRDVETWSPADFVRYVIVKLREHGVCYVPKNPVDYIVIGQLMKNFRLTDRTKYSLKTEIDKVFENKTFSYINSLSFLRSLIQQVPLSPKKKRYKNTLIVLSEELKKKLRELKEEINK